MTQTGLIEQIIESLGLEVANGKLTPVTETLACYKDHESFNGWFNYWSIVGMILYLASTTWPDISFAINQCARFSSDPKEPHATALKKIGGYLKMKANKGLVLRKCSKIPKLNCYMDADFAGLYSKEDPKDPTSVQSRTGYVITLGDNPVIWHSKLQTEIALSTMSAEYIALSAAMCSLIHLQNIHHEVVKMFQLLWNKESTISTVYKHVSSSLPQNHLNIHPSLARLPLNTTGFGKN